LRKPVVKVIISAWPGWHARYFRGIPHHVTQRGNGRAQTFFEDADYALYRYLLAEHCAALDWMSGLGTKGKCLVTGISDDRSAEDSGYDQSRLGGALMR